MIDISKNELTIKLYESVLKNYLEPKTIPFCRPRRCDAFVYILGGSCRYVFPDKRTFTAHAGDILYLSEGAVYEMTILERYDFICFNFFFDAIATRSSDVFTPKDRGSVENLFFRAWRFGSGGSLPAKMSIAYQIYDHVISSRITSYLSSSNRAKIDEAVAIIVADANGEVSVSSLAYRAGMSEVYFRKLFKKVTGISPAKFITDHKVGRAKELLLEDYLTLEEIAERCGFSTLSYFCRVFKASTGMTPGVFRDTLVN
jgi:AraC-like DNA-binding protein